MRAMKKYTPLADKIKQMWLQKAVIVVPIILLATGLIPKSLFHILDIINLKYNLYKEIQKTIITDTCSLTRKFLTDITYTHLIEQ